MTEKDIFGVPLLLGDRARSLGSEKTMVVHKPETFLANAKTPGFSTLSLISRGYCNYIFAVFVYVFFKAKTSPLAFDIMT